MKSPCPSLVTVRVKPVSACVALTAAEETTAPLASTTVPRILAVICCELPEVAIHPASTHTTNVLNANLIEITLPLSVPTDRDPPASRHNRAESFAMPRREFKWHDYREVSEITQ